MTESSAPPQYSEFELGQLKGVTNYQTEIEILGQNQTLL